MTEQAPERLTRRRFLVGAGAVTTVLGAGATTWAYHALGLDGDDGTVPSVTPGRRVSGSFVSQARGGRRCGWTIAWPPGVRDDARLPVAVVLHGRGNDHASAFSRGYLGLDRFLARAAARGSTPFALASVDGGEAYWHARADGDDPAAMVTDELLPLLEHRGLDVRRVGLLGWSMGGFGALHLARLLGPERVAGVAVMSPALWHRYEDTAPGAYDDEADFAAVTACGRERDLAGIPLRVDCGEGDPFFGATRDYVRGFARRPAGGFQRGNHDLGYWRRMAPAELAFLGRAFEA